MRILANTLAVALALTCISTPACAAEWWMLGLPWGEKPKRAMFFVDKSTIQDFGGFRRVWVDAILESPSEPNILSYVQLDCKQGRHMGLQVSYRFKDGRQRRNTESEWRYIEPSSPMRMIADNVCGMSFYDGIVVPKGMSPEEFSKGVLLASGSTRPR